MSNDVWDWLFNDKVETNLAKINPQSARQDTLEESIVKKLLPFQVQPVIEHIHILKKYNITVDASFCGIGKTYIYCAVAKAMGLKPLIVSPKAVLPSINDVSNYFGLTCFGIINYEKLKTGKTPYGYWDDKRRRFIYKIDPNSIIIFDEAHRLKAYDSYNCKLGISAKESGYPMMAVSATLATSPIEMRFLGYALGLHNLKDYYRWCFHNGCVKTRFGLQYVGGRKKMEILHKKIFPERGCRIKPSDVIGLFPETTISSEMYEGDSIHIKKAYKEMSMELKAIKKTRSQSPMVVQQKFHQQIELLKVPIVTELAEDYGDEDMSVVIFVNFRNTMIALCDKLKCKSIHGGQDSRERQIAIERFQDDRDQYLVCMTQAGGEGISLHSIGDKRMRLALINPSFNSTQIKQALGRVHRAGGNPSIQKLIFVKDTPEERACLRVRTKLQNLSMLNDGDLSDMAGI